jgi:hypothetical protein
MATGKKIFRKYSLKATALRIHWRGTTDYYERREVNIVSIIKFGIFALPAFQYFPFIGSDVSLSKNVRLVSSNLGKLLQVNNVNYWSQWLGSIEWDFLKDRELYLSIVIESKDPKTNNREDIEIMGELEDVYRSLMISGPFRTQDRGPISFTGHGEVKDDIINIHRIHSVSRLNSWNESHYMYEKGYHGRKIRCLKSSGAIEKWASIARDLGAVRKMNKNKSSVILVALESFRRGLESTYLDFRLPYFVRATESVVAARRGKTKEDYISRSLKLLKDKPIPLFVGPNSNLESLLNDVFELRNGFIHGMPYGWKILNKLNLKSKTRIAQYAYLAEESARRCLVYALGTPALIEASGNRNTLEEWCTKNW